MTTRISPDASNDIQEHFYNLDANPDDAYEIGLDEFRIENGELVHGIDLSHYSGPERVEIEEALQEIAEKMEKLQNQIQSASGQAKSQPFMELRQMSAKLTELAEQIESGTLEVRGLKPKGPGQPEAPGAEEGAQAASEFNKETGATSEADDDPSPKFEEMIEDVSGSVRSFETDPKGFFEDLKGMTSEERGHVLTAVQNEIQANNRLMSMLTNFQQAMHDTQKAVISNLRV